MSNTRYRNTLEDVVGVAIRKAKEEGNDQLAEALTRWRCSTDFRDPVKNGRSLHGFTQGMDAVNRRKFADAVSHARGIAEASSRNSLS